MMPAVLGFGPCGFSCSALWASASAFRSSAADGDVNWQLEIVNYLLSMHGFPPRDVRSNELSQYLRPLRPVPRHAVAVRPDGVDQAHEQGRDLRDAGLPRRSGYADRRFAADHARRRGQEG